MVASFMLSCISLQGSSAFSPRVLATVPVNDKRVVNHDTHLRLVATYLDSGTDAITPTGLTRTGRSLNRRR